MSPDRNQLYPIKQIFITQRNIKWVYSTCCIAKSQNKIYVYYFTEEMSFNFQVIINKGGKQYRYLD